MSLAMAQGAANSLAALAPNTLNNALPGMYCVFPHNGWDPLHFDIASPAGVERRLNQQFPMTSEIPQYFTMVYGILDQHTGKLR